MVLISRVLASNFKTFDALDVALGPFNVLIGPNASGKSTFVSIFRFLKDIAESGLENAISMQGGVEYLLNMNSGLGNPLSCGITVVNLGREITLPVVLPTGSLRRKFLEMQIEEISYNFSMNFREREHEVTQEDMSAIGNLIDFRSGEKASDLVRMNLKKRANEITLTVSPRKYTKNFKEAILPRFERRTHRQLASRSALLFERPFSPFYGLQNSLRRVSIYDFDARLSKRSTLITGRRDLEYDGSNLAIVLKNILEDSKKSERLQRLVADVLPFVRGFEVEKLADRSILARFKETYSKINLPAPLISDGTINVTALLVALFLESDGPAIIEEPEKNVHPSLISRLVEMMKDVSASKQVIITTHNPLLVKYAGIENILLVKRDNKGFSTLSRPSDKEEVKAFLRNNMGVDELYVQNLL